MARPDRFIALADELIRNISDADSQRALRQLRRGRRVLIKIAKVAGLMLASAIVIPVAMITAGLLLGPSGYEGLIAAPLTVLVAWGLILYWAFGGRSTRRAIANADMGELPGRVEEWLDRQRAALPASAQPRLDAIALRLDALKPQLRGLDPQLLEALQLRRLLAEELPDLVLGYRKVPPALQRRPLHDGPSPEQRLVDALATVDEQLGRLQQRIADGDLRSLATHQRYLELKYKGGGKLD